MAIINRPWLPAYSQRYVTRRKFLAGAAAAGGAAALIACGGSGSTTKLAPTIDPASARKPGAVWYARNDYQLADETAAAVAGGVYPGRLATDLGASMDPFLGTASGFEDFIDQSYEYLVRPNRGPGIQPGTDEYRKIMPQLAESWELADDAMSYTFTLRRGVKFHPVSPVNGREMTMDDWRTSFQRFSEVKAERMLFLNTIDKLEFPDARHMVIKTKQPYGPFMTRMPDKDFGFRIVPRELNADPGMAATKVAGTNARILDKAQPSLTYEFKRFDEYWQRKPFIDRWHYPIITEAANAYAQFLTKNIISYNPGSRDALALRKDAPESVMVSAEVTRLNTNRQSFGNKEATTAPWKDPRVRIAMRRAVNWDAILDFDSNRQAFAAAGIEVEARPATHMPPDPDYWLDPRQGELGKASENYLYDVGAAKQLLEAAGHPQGFDIDMYGQLGSATERIGLILDEYKKFSLIRVNMVWLPSREQFYNEIVYQQTPFKGIMATFAANVGSDMEFMLGRFYESTGDSSPYPDPKTDELIMAQRRATDPGKRAEVFKDFQRHVATYFPLVPSHGLFAGWTFQWPWLHNSNQPVHLQWLDEAMPKRNG